MLPAHLVNLAQRESNIKSTYNGTRNLHSIRRRLSERSTRRLTKINNSLLGKQEAEKPKFSESLNQKRHDLITAIPRVDYENLAMNLINVNTAVSLANNIHVTQTRKASTSDSCTVYDPRLGSVNSKPCSTCYRTDDCPGHYGLINLALPFYNPYTMPVIIKVLRSVCNSCGAILMSKETIEEAGLFNLTGLKRLDAIAQKTVSASGMICTNNRKLETSDEELAQLIDTNRCRKNPLFSLTESRKRMAITFSLSKSAANEVMPIKEVVTILSAITERDAKILGFNHTHPRDCILKVLLVIPPCSRPDAYVSGIMQTNKLTAAYEAIIDSNNQLTQKIKEGNDHAKLQHKLQNLLYGLICIADKPAGSRAANYNMVSLLNRLGKKDGLFRQALMGRRTNQTARTVIAINPDLEFGQASLPGCFAPLLTKRIRVTRYNLAYVTQLWQKQQISYIKFGPHRGAYQGIEIKINPHRQQQYKPEIGDWVDRWLQEGDRVIINRQPSLHRFNLVTVRVVLNPTDNIISFPESMAPPFNADFDGDAMHILVPQNPEAEAEMRYLIPMERMIMNGVASKPVAGPSFDPILGAYILTQDEKYIDEETGLSLYRSRILPRHVYYSLLTLLSNNDSAENFDMRAFLHGVENFSAKALLSHLFPADFNYNHKGVKIVEGIFIQGELKKAHTGFGRSSILHSIQLQYGHQRAAQYITDFEHLIINWMNTQAISIGLADIAPDGDEISDLIAERRAEILQIAEAMLDGKARNPLERDLLEEALTQQLLNLTNVGASIINEYLPHDNNMARAAISGAKGNAQNTSLIMSGGQVLHRGRRFQRGVGQKLPYFRPCDDVNAIMDIREGGVTNNGFVRGNDVADYFFRGQAGREGLANTAVTTKKTGSMGHNLHKFVEDLRTTANGGVETVQGNIVQFIYGDDGFDSVFLQLVKSASHIDKFENMRTFTNVRKLVHDINIELACVDY